MLIRTPMVTKPGRIVQPVWLRIVYSFQDSRIFPRRVEAALAVGAVMNDHYGVGLRLAPFMAAEYGSGSQTLRQIKQALDPNNVLCPGKLGLG